MSDIICGKWMPRAGAYCARGLGHPPGLCASPEAMESQRQRGRARERVYDPADVVRWRAYLGQAQRESRSGQSRGYPSEYPRAEHSGSPSTSKTYG